MDVIGSDHIFRVYRLHPGEGNVTRQLAGRFIVYQDSLHILEDYFGVLHQNLQEGPVTSNTNRVLTRLGHSAYYDVVSEGEVKEGHRIDLVPEADLGDPDQSAPDAAPGALGVPKGQSQKPVFTYQRKGMSPQTIEFRDGKAYMNGHILAPEEMKRLLDHHQTGEAFITYKA